MQNIGDKILQLYLIENQIIKKKLIKIFGYFKNFPYLCIVNNLKL